MACCLLLGAAAPARAASGPAELADRLAERWTGLQRPNGTFPDSIRPGSFSSGRYAEAGMGYGLLLAGIRAHRPDWVEAGARAQAYAARQATDRLSVFESMLLASGYNLLRSRAPATPAFAAASARSGRSTCARSSRSTTSASTPTASPPTSTWSRRSRTSSSPAAACARKSPERS